MSFSFHSLSWCNITERGFKALAAALRSNPSAVRELDLSWNKPELSGVQVFSELQTDPEFKALKISGLTFHSA